MLKLNPFKNISIKNKLLVSFLVLGVIPFTVIGFLSLSESSNVITDQAFEKLKTVQEIKKAQVEEFIKRCQNDVIVLSKNTAIHWNGYRRRVSRSYRSSYGECTRSRHGNSNELSFNRAQFRHDCLPRAVRTDRRSFRNWQHFLRWRISLRCSDRNLLFSH